MIFDASQFNGPYIMSCGYKMKNFIILSINYNYSDNSYRTYIFNPTLIPIQSNTNA